MKLSKSDRMLYVIIVLNLVVCIFANALISILDMSFTWDTLISGKFWINVGITQVLTIIPYITCISLGQNESNKRDEIIAIQVAVKKDFDVIDTTFLSNDLDEYIEIQNLEYKCIGRINLLNYQISRCKDNTKRKQLALEKDNCIQWRNYYRACNTQKEKPEIPDVEYDVASVRCKCESINVRAFKTIDRSYANSQIGSFNEAEVVTRDSAKKIALSLIITCLFAVGGEGFLTGGWQGVYNVVWRTFLILLNAFQGYKEGVKIVEVYKYCAFKEKKEILNNFFNKMFVKGKIELK